MKKVLAVSSLCLFLGVNTAHARSYEFTVNCSSGSKVVQWGIGEIDPGKEYLRVATGTNNPGCGISDYVPSRDSHLPVERHDGAGAVFQGAKLPALIGTAALGGFGGVLKFFGF